MALPQKSKASSSVEELADWMAKFATRVNDVLLSRNVKDAREALLHDEVDEDWSALDNAKRIFAMCRSDAELLGGRQTYKVTLCGKEGNELSSTVVTFETGRDFADPLANVTGESAYAIKAIENIVNKQTAMFTCLVGHYKDLLDRTLTHNQQLHEKVLSQFAAVEDAMSKKSERDLAASESAARSEMVSKSVEAIVKTAQVFVPVAMSKKLGIPQEVMADIIGGMMAQAPATAPAPAPTPAPESSGEKGPIVTPPDSLGGMLASIPDEKMIEILAAMSPEAIGKMFASLPDHLKPKAIELLKKLESQA